MTLVLSGENDFERLQALKQLLEDFKKEYGDFGIEKIDASEVDFGRLLETVASLPFLASRRMVILYDPSTSKIINDKIDELLNSVADTTDLVIVERKFDKRQNLYKTLKRKTDFREYSNLEERKLSDWLSRRSKELGGQLTVADAAYLIHRVGANQILLSNELDKLIGYNPKINRSSIDLLTEQEPQSTVFELLDAAFAGDKQKAIKLYEDQRKQQAEPQMIMGMIAWQLHILAVVKYNENMGSQAIASTAKLSPYTVNKTMALATRLKRDEVRDLVGRALKLDIKLKSEAIDADDVVQHFLLTI